MNLKKIGRVVTSKFVGTGPSSYENRIYRAAVSQRLRNTSLDASLTFIVCLKSVCPSTCIYSAYTARICAKFGNYYLH